MKITHQQWNEFNNLIRTKIVAKYDGWVYVAHHTDGHEIFERDNILCLDIHLPDYLNVNELINSCLKRMNPDFRETYFQNLAVSITGNINTQISVWDIHVVSTEIKAQAFALTMSELYEEPKNE